MNYIVYTAIFGGKDKIENFVWRDKPDRFICFTDNLEAENKFVTVVKAPKITSNDILNAKFFKLFPHLFFKDYRYSIWVDGNMQLKETFNPEKLIEEHLQDNDLALYAHPSRDCVYDEAQECIRLNVDRRSVISEQIATYERNKLPRHSGLGACGFLVRRHSSIKLVSFFISWWNEIIKFSNRDQISFGYLTWRLKYPYATIPGFYEDNENYKRVAHSKQKTSNTLHNELRPNESARTIMLPFSSK